MEGDPAPIIVQGIREQGEREQGGQGREREGEGVVVEEERESM